LGRKDLGNKELLGLWVFSKTQEILTSTPILKIPVFGSSIHFPDLQSTIDQQSLENIKNIYLLRRISIKRLAIQWQLLHLTVTKSRASALQIETAVVITHIPNFLPNTKPYNHWVIIPLSSKWLIAFTLELWFLATFSNLHFFRVFCYFMLSLLNPLANLQKNFYLLSLAEFLDTNFYYF